MDREHRFTFRASDSAIGPWAEAGITVKQGLNTVVVRESQPRWEKVKALVAAEEGVDLIAAVFDDREFDEANVLGLRPSWHHGYPQPDDDFGYLNVTYDLTGGCRHCGAGRRQDAPFRMKAEPKWGRRSILQLNWVFDEYFVTPELWERAFKPFGVEAREVISAKTLNPLQSVVQIVVPNVVKLKTPSTPFENCSACTSRRYEPISADFIPMPEEMVGSLAKSEQMFGSGGSSWRLILCSQLVRQALLNAGATGATFHPCR